MNRTFTLKRLMINITALCVIFALVRAFPADMLLLALKIAAILPTLFIVVLFAYLPPRRFIHVVFAAIGSALGSVLAATVFASWSVPPTWWSIFKLAFSTVGLGGIVGALVFGGLCWLFSLAIHSKAK